MQVWRQEPAIPHIHKQKHPKGFGTDKERHTKRQWHEIRCTKHGIIRFEPRNRFERLQRGCPVCYNLIKREVRI